MKPRAFTLLEVLVAIAVLGVSLVTIIHINAVAVADHLYARKLTVATLLARSKLVDLEQRLYDKPLPADDDEDSGDFSDEGWPSFKWRAKIIAPKMNGLTPEQLAGALFNLPIGGKDGADPAALASMLGLPKDALPKGDDKQPGGLLALLGPMAPMAQAQLTQMVQQLQSSVREVHLTVSWKEGRLTESVDVTTHVVSLGPGSDRNGGALVTNASGNAAPKSSIWVRPDTGAQVPNPRPSGDGGMVDPADGARLITLEQYQAQRGIPGLPVPPNSLLQGFDKGFLRGGFGLPNKGGFR